MARKEPSPGDLIYIAAENMVRSDETQEGIGEIERYLTELGVEGYPLEIPPGYIADDGSEIAAPKPVSVGEFAEKFEAYREAGEDMLEAARLLDV